MALKLYIDYIRLFFVLFLADFCNIGDEMIKLIRYIIYRYFFLSYVFVACLYFFLYILCYIFMILIYLYTVSYVKVYVLFLRRNNDRDSLFVLSLETPAHVFDDGHCGACKGVVESIIL